MFKVKIGNNNVAVEIVKSYVPYSVVDNTLVYKGTNKKLKFLKKNYLLLIFPYF